MATVAKREWTYKGKRKTAWVVRYVDIGRKQRLKTFVSKREADLFRLQVENELGDGIHVPDAETITAGEAIRAFMMDCQRRWTIGDMAGNTFKGYSARAHLYVIPAFEGIKLNKLTTGHVQALVDRLLLKLKKSTIKCVLIIIGQTLKMAVRKKWIRRNPLVDDPIVLPRNLPKKRIVPPSFEEMQRIFDSLTKRAAYEQPHAMRNRILSFVLGLIAGLRRGEIGALEWRHVDFERNILYVEHSQSRYDGIKTTKSPAGVRQLPMAPIVRAVLSQALLEIGKPEGFVLRNRDGNMLHVDSIGAASWQEVLVRAGIVDEGGKHKYTLHTLRHGFVSLLFAEGLHPLHIKQLVGHSRLSTTMDTYAHILSDNRLAQNAIGGIAAGLSTPLIGGITEPELKPVGAKAWHEARERAMKLLDDGELPQEVGKRLGVSEKVVYKWMAVAEGRRRPMRSFAPKPLPTTRNDKASLSS